MKISMFFWLICAPSLAFAETTSFSCAFDRVASPDGVKSEVFKMDFLLDRQNGKAYVLGNNGSSDAEWIPSAYGVTFVERTLAGNVMVTAIQLSTGQAVHSRNTVFEDKIVPTQYYGHCKAK